MDKNVSETAQEIIEEIHNYIRERGGNYKEWCAGITKEAHNGTFVKITLNSQCWIYKEAESPPIAREVLNYLVNILGINGDYSMADSAGYASIVYAYKKKTYMFAQKSD